MRIGNPHMGWCSVERLHEWWHWASHKGGGRGQREVEKRGIQLGHVRRGRVWGRGGVALDKHGLVAVGLACSLSRDQLSLEEEEDKGTGRLELEGIEL